jgi:hypothetical protein
VLAQVQSHDFTISGNPWPITATAGKPVFWTLKVNSTSTGIPTQIWLSCFVPSPASCNTSQVSVYPNAEANVIVNTSVNSLPQYHVIVTGTSGTITHSYAFTINVRSYLPMPTTYPPFVPTVPIVLSTASQEFAASMGVRPIYNQGDTLYEYMTIYNTGNKIIPANAMSGTVSILSNGHTIFSDNFNIGYNIMPGMSTNPNGAEIAWQKGSWVVPSNIQSGWYALKLVITSKDTQQTQTGQMFFQILNTSSVNSSSSITTKSTQSRIVSPQNITSYVSTDQKELLVIPYQDTTVKILGSADAYDQQRPIEITLVKPDGTTEDFEVFGTNVGYFQTSYMFNQDSLSGSYHVYAKYGNTNIGNTVFDVTHEQQGAISDKIPFWFKTTAKWWSEGKISSSEFINALKFLLEDDVIHVESIPMTGGLSPQIPTWVQNNAELWSHNRLSDQSFIGTIQYLISVGII